MCGYIIISFKRINRLPSGKGYKPSESFDGTVDHTLSQEHERCFESAHVSNNHEAPLPGGQVHDPSTRHDLIEQRRHTTAHESFEMRSQQEHALQPWSHVCEPNWSGDKEPHKTYIRKSWSHDRHGFTPQQSNRPPQLCLESEIL